MRSYHAKERRTHENKETKKNENDADADSGQYHADRKQYPGTGGPKKFRWV